MAINPYTLNCLYEKGIIDYVPTELLMPTPISSFETMQNPYVNLAKTGALYQQYGQDRDSFMYSNAAGIQGNNQIGGGYMNRIKNMFGFGQIGAYSNTGFNIYGEAGIGNNSTMGVENTFGGFQDAKMEISNGINKLSGLHPLIKGLIAAPILFITIASCLRFKKKPKTGTGSKLNPLNWFRKPKPQPVKRSFWSRLTGKK